MPNARSKQKARDVERRVAARVIDPYTAEVIWCYGLILDPYGDGLPLRGNERCVGRNWFARAPDSEQWIWFGDFPESAIRVLNTRPCIDDDNDLPF